MGIVLLYSAIVGSVIASNAVTFALVLLVGAGVGAGVVYLKLRKQHRPAQLISQRLRAVASGLETDLLQLQIDDAFGHLSHGWNQLVRTVAEAKDELETAKIQQDAEQIMTHYNTGWITDLLNKLPDGLLTINEQLEITFANTAAMHLLARSQDKIVQKRITDVFDESLTCVRPSTGGALDRTFELPDDGGTLRLISVPWGGGGGNGETAIFLRDVTALKEQERSRDQFLYHITHELRTPLTNIRAYAETLSEGVLDDPDSLRECYNVIVGETQRLSRLVEDILSLSQMEVGTVRLTMDDVQTARLIRRVVEDMQANADDKNIELVLSLPAKVPTIRGDKERLAVVLTNLIGNAVKYTPAGGRVEVSCAEDGTRMRISVSDTGMGIPKEEQEKIFDKFYRARNDEVAQLPGTGLGLAIARETVRAHGGTIELESEPGKGSTFTAVLPIGKTADLGAWETK